eukprot:1142302-Pelagomonas_calceolata.AAC.9
MPYAKILPPESAKRGHTHIHTHARMHAHMHHAILLLSCRRQPQPPPLLGHDHQEVAQYGLPSSAGHAAADVHIVGILQSRGAHWACVLGRGDPCVLAPPQVMMFVMFYIKAFGGQANPIPIDGHFSKFSLLVMSFDARELPLKQLREQACIEESALKRPLAQACYKRRGAQWVVVANLIAIALYHRG